MSQYQFKGDRSDVQLKKAGRSSGPGHQRSGAPSTAVKGGGAGGLGPSGSAPPSSGASYSSSQSFPTAAAAGRPTTPGSSSSRGGKRVNGPPGLGRNAQGGGSGDHGANYRSPHFGGGQYHNQQSQHQQPATVARQGLGTTDANQHSSATSGDADSKQSTSSMLPVSNVPGSRATGSGIPLPKQVPSNMAAAAPKPPTPVVASTNAAILEPTSPVANASSGDSSRSSTQQSFSFQFGSISPGFMQVPARTSSAPPNMDDLKREQERFEASRSTAGKKGPPVPSGQQVSRVAGSANEPLPVLQPSQNVNARGLSPVAGASSAQVSQGGQSQGLAQPAVQFSQGHPAAVQGHGPQQSQNHVHMSPQHLQHVQLVAGQAQGQQTPAHVQHPPQPQHHQPHSQHQPQQNHHHQPQHPQQHSQQHPQHQPQPHQQHLQQHPQQQVLSQQGLVQQSLSQGMKYAQSMMPMGPGSQIMPQQMGVTLPGQQLSAHQVPPQMASQLGPQLGGVLGSQLPPGLSGAPYAPPTPNQFMHPQESKAVKIVDPHTKEEVRFDAKSKKGESLTEAGTSASSAVPAARLASNGPQSRPLNYGSGPPHGMVPPAMNFYQQIPPFGSPHYYQPVASKSVPTPSGPAVNAPISRYNHGQQTPNQGPRFLNHSGTGSNPPVSKAAVASSVVGNHGAQAGADIMSGLPAPPIAVSSSGPPPHPVIPAVSAAIVNRPAPALQPLQAGGGHTASSNGRAAGLASAPTPASSGVSMTMTPGGGLKFGDVESSSSGLPVTNAELPADAASATSIPSAGINGLSLNVDPNVPNHTASIGPSEVLPVKKDQHSRGSGNLTTALPRPTVSVPPLKTAFAPSVTSDPSPRVGITPGGSGEKPKTESSKPTITRKGSKKEQKLQKQQHAQPHPPSAAVSSEGEAERKGEVPAPASTAVGSQQVTTGTPAPAGGSANVAPPKGLQRSQSGLQSSSAVSHTLNKSNNPSGRLDDTKGASKTGAELEARASGKSIALSLQNSEVPLPTSSEADDGGRKAFSKTNSGKILSSPKSTDGKDATNFESASVIAKPALLSKQSSLNARGSSASLPKEPNVVKSEEVLPKKVSGFQATALPETLKENSLSDAVALEKPLISDVTDSTSELRKGLKSDESATNANSSPPQSTVPVASPFEETLNDEVESSRPGILDETKPDSVIDVDSLSPQHSYASEDDHHATVDEQAPLRDVEVTDQAVGKIVVPNNESPAANREDTETPPSGKDVNEQKDLLKADQTSRNTSELSNNAVEELQNSADADKNVTGGEVLTDSKAAPLETEVTDSGSGIVAEDFKSTSEEEKKSHDSASKIEGGEKPAYVEAGSREDDGSPASPGRNLNSADRQLSLQSPAGEEIVIEKEQSEKLPNGQLRDGSVTGTTVGGTALDIQSDNVGSTEEPRGREGQESGSLGSGNSGVEVVATSKKKKKKDILSKADAQGPTADLFTAYKAPEEKKLTEGKKVETPSTNPGTAEKKDSDSAPSSEKSAVRELDDWEDAAELPTPNMASAPSSNAPNIYLAPADARIQPDFGIKKYSRDYMLSQASLFQDLPPHFEIRADIAEFVLKKSSVAFSEALLSPGRILDRQSSGGPRMERRNSNLGSEDDRWTRQGGPLVSPGRGPSDARMDVGLSGPPGGFRPGQNNAGLVGARPGIRPAMSPSGIPMGAILPGGPLLPHNMIPQGPGRNMSGIDADRWIRTSVPQKGLMPSPRTPLPAIHKTENRYQVGKISDEEQVKQRQIKSVLNKLTPQNFDKLFAQVKEVNIDSATTLTGVISQIFDKALTEPTFCEMYAKFCADLAKELPEFVEGEEKITFKRVLLNKCQEEFQREEREQEEAEKAEDGEVKLTDEEREERKVSARKRMLGNIRFIGELYKMNMLTERIMHECIRKLLGEYQNPDEEDVEALCKLMTTIGKIIDYERAKEHIDAYFQRMEILSENHKLSSRLRFMLKDVIDLRRNGWIVRRKVEGPKKIDEVHRDAVQERQQAASGGLQRMMSGGRRLGNDFPMRSIPSPVFSPGPQMGGKPIGVRGMPSPGPVRGGFVQDVRMEDRFLMDNSRPMMPLTPRPSDEGNLTLGPQGGLGRGMSARPSLGLGRSALADMAPIMMNDVPRRTGMGMSGHGGMPERLPYMGRDDPSVRVPVGERHVAPLLDKPHGPDRLGPSLSGRDLRGPDRHSVERSFSGNINSALRPITPPTPVARSAPATPLQLSEADLKKKSISAITEFFSVRIVEEAAQCVDDLKTPAFHPTLVSLWVSEAFDMKDADRDQLMKLLVYASKERNPSSLTPEQINKGFELVLSTLEDTTVDVPKAPHYVGRMFAKLVVAGVTSLSYVGKQLKEGGVEPGSLLEGGDALTIFGFVLDGIRREKGEGSMIDLYRESKLNLEDYLPPYDKRMAGKFEDFLDKNGFQSLYPMIPLEKYFREAIAKDEPVTEIQKWMEKNVPQATRSESSFSRMIMTQVLRNSVLQDSSGKAVTHDLKVLEEKVKKFGTLLKKFPSGHERQYILAVQLFANDLNHPPGLISALFRKLYGADVISEEAFLKWKDDVKDSTPGRDKAIKDTVRFFQWLDEAPEEIGDD